jgi:hypothetical protein
LAPNLVYLKASATVAAKEAATAQTMAES